MPTWRIPLSVPHVGEEDYAAVADVIRRPWLTAGPEVEAFEEEFAALLGLPHAVAVSGGTAALHLALIGLGVGPGDEVVQPALNFVAAANMTRAVGAKPVFADIVALDDPVVDPGDILSLLTPRTRAVVVMHYGGYLAGAAELAEPLRDRGVVLIEDAAHAPGAGTQGAMAGAIGDVGCFSFYGNKNLVTGEGGMVVTADDAIAERMRALRSHGMTSGAWQRRTTGGTYDVTESGFNYRIDELRAALGRVQLRKLIADNARRGELVGLYRSGIASAEGWSATFARRDLSEGAHHLMVAVAPDEAARDRAVEALTAAGIQTTLHYPVVADFTAFAGVAPEGLERSRDFAARAVTLPLFASMTADQVSEVCTVLAAG